MNVTSNTISVIVMLSLCICAARESVSAQTVESGPTVTLGLSAQSDFRTNRTRPRGDFKSGGFQISPVGLAGGVGFRHEVRSHGTIGLLARVAWFPLIMIESISPAVGAVPNAPSNLSLATFAIEWTASSLQHSTWAPFATAGMTRAVQTPRVGYQNALMIGIGASHQLARYAELRWSLELDIVLHGTSYLQLPFAVALGKPR